MATLGQTTLFSDDAEKVGTNFGDPNFAENKSLPVHRWVPWIAGFSSTFVSGIIDDFLNDNGVIIDSFAGVGTTLVEGMARGHDVVGFEINPYAAMASRIKLAATSIDRDKLSDLNSDFLRFYTQNNNNGYTPESQTPSGFRTRSEFYSEEVEQKVLIVWDFISTIEDQLLKDVFRIAFAATMVGYSNYSYEPSLGTRKAAGRPIIKDADVGGIVHAKLVEVVEDIGWLNRNTLADQATSKRVIEKSFFEAEKFVEPSIGDLLITSPPYLNNYHYIRNTRPHLYWLGFAESPKDYKPIEENNFGKYWQTVRDEVEPVELNFDDPPQELVQKIEQLRSVNPDKGTYSGHGWANYAAEYFNDAYRFGESLRHVLRPGGRAFVVVGNSILQGINFRTDELLGQVCERAGLDLLGVHTPRATRQGNSIIQSQVRVKKARSGHTLYESVVELRKS